MGAFKSLPLIIFSYMYQPNIPALYTELNRRNMKNMKKVIGVGTALATTLFFMAALGGYVTFVKHPDLHKIMTE